jgi:hypothetical protein
MGRWNSILLRKAKGDINNKMIKTWWFLLKNESIRTFQPNR